MHRFLRYCFVAVILYSATGMEADTIMIAMACLGLAYLIVEVDRNQYLFRG